MKDPLEEVPPSEVPPSEAAIADIGFGAGHASPQSQVAMVLPGSCPVTLTPQGILLFLGRKERPRPLLRLICRACGASSHDPDPIVDGTCVECLCFELGLAWIHEWYRIYSKSKRVCSSLETC